MADSIYIVISYERIVENRENRDRLIFIMENPILRRRDLDIEAGPMFKELHAGWQVLWLVLNRQLSSVRINDYIAQIIYYVYMLETVARET